MRHGCRSWGNTPPAGSKLRRGKLSSAGSRKAAPAARCPLWRAGDARSCDGASKPVRGGRLRGTGARQLDAVPLQAGQRGLRPALRRALSQKSQLGGDILLLASRQHRQALALQGQHARRKLAALSRGPSGGRKLRRLFEEAAQPADLAGGAGVHLPLAIEPLERRRPHLRAVDEGVPDADRVGVGLGEPRLQRLRSGLRAGHLLLAQVARPRGEQRGEGCHGGTCSTSRRPMRRGQGI
mmetsp:Transcript_88132/g.257614  ORF Transcript_88132/g.257614 Transcript_88132/m.257614 type:complete len:239 (+) Transcript_88132:588-1304(+)